MSVLWFFLVWIQAGVVERSVGVRIERPEGAIRLTYEPVEGAGVRGQ